MIQSFHICIYEAKTFILVLSQKKLVCSFLLSAGWNHSIVYVLSTMGVSKESISKFLIGNRFHVKLRILSPENCKQSLRVKS